MHEQAGAQSVVAATCCGWGYSSRLVDLGGNRHRRVQRRPLPWQWPVGEHLNAGEQLIRRHRQLAATIDRAHTRPLDRHPVPAESDRALLGAVTHRRPVRVVLALRAACRGHVGVHHRGHHLKPNAHRHRQQALADIGDDLDQRDGHRFGHSQCRREPYRSSGSSVSRRSPSWWCLSPTPNTYRKAGVRRGTATANSMRPGQTYPTCPVEDLTQHISIFNLATP